MKQILFMAGLSLGVIACTSDKPNPQHEHQPTSETDAKIDPSKITLGNENLNSIDTADISRDGNEFTFKQVIIDEPGFLVMHPFRDGKPVQTEYVGASLLKAGTTKAAKIAVSDQPETGDMYIVMLHSDANKDGVFDLGDGITVPDVPIFEGTRLIAHRIQAP